MAATQKMINYAKNIADILNMHYPDFTDYWETSTFISTNVDKFKIVLQQKQLELQLNSITNKNNIQTTNEFDELILKLQNVGGIYIFWENDNIVYVGKSMNLQGRIPQSLQDRLKMTPDINYLSIICCDSDADVHILEILLITELKPLCNRDCICKDTSKYFKSNVDISKLQKISIFKED